MKKTTFRIGIWDHCRYVTDREHPYDEMARHLERMRKCGVTLADIYLPEVISLDDYCRAAANCGMELEVRFSPAGFAEELVRRVLPEAMWAGMESRYHIRLAGACGNRPDNREIYRKKVQQISEAYAGRIAGIQLDHIRNENAVLLMEYPCQCDVCKALYKRYFGTETVTEEMLKEPAVLYKLLAIRNRNIRQTVVEMKKIASAHNLSLTVAARANYVNSADITAPPVWGLGPAVLEGQDWVDWVEDGLVEEVFPMNYHTSLELFQSVLNDHIRLLGEHAKRALFPGIGVHSSMGINPPEKVAERLDIVKRSGLPGAMLFNKTNVYDDDYCAVIRSFAG